MPTVPHPRDRKDVAGHPPSQVTVNGSNYPVDDGQVDLPDETAVAALGRAYGLDADDLTGSDGCPHCDAYEGDHVEQHVAQAHPDA